MEGWGYKKRTTNVPHVYQKRYFRLDAGSNLLEYSIKPSDLKPRGSIDAREIKRIYPSTPDEIGSSKLASSYGSLGMTIATDARVYYLLWEDEESRNNWLSSIMDAALPNEPKLHPVFRGVLGITKLPADAARDIDSPLITPVVPDNYVHSAAESALSSSLKGVPHMALDDGSAASSYKKASLLDETKPKSRTTMASAAAHTGEVVDITIIEDTADPDHGADRLPPPSPRGSIRKPNSLARTFETGPRSRPSSQPRPQITYVDQFGGPRGGLRTPLLSAIPSDQAAEDKDVSAGEPAAVPAASNAAAAADQGDDNRSVRPEWLGAIMKEGEGESSNKCCCAIM